MNFCLEREDGFSVFAVDDLSDGAVEGTGSAEDPDDSGNHRDLRVVQEVT